MRRRLILLAVAASCGVLTASPSLADPTAPTHHITDELHGTWTDQPSGDTAPTPGVVYTKVTIDHSDWYDNQPIHDHFEFSKEVADNIEVEFTTYAADGSVASHTFYYADNQGYTTTLSFAPDFSTVRLSGTLHAFYYDGTSETDRGDQPIDWTLTASAHHVNRVPGVSPAAVDLDLGSGSATGTLTANLGTLWSGTVPNTRFDRTDHLVETTS